MLLFPILSSLVDEETKSRDSLIQLVLALIQVS
jgi:hypothetical protein